MLQLVGGHEVLLTIQLRAKDLKDPTCNDVAYRQQLCAAWAVADAGHSSQGSAGGGASLSNKAVNDSRDEQT